ncbi:Proclotting enzyme [Papilio machaon]|uniref:Proclotting enzyme n=1 Tax=Papilio machaon TaxID=76193 RepID=A0A194RD24_PAPMA|nr:Proclotting enzyme [Papilio machaon]
MKHSTSPTPNYPRSTSPLPAPANYQPTTASAAVKRYKYLRRLYKFDQMDFEFAAWQMVYLFVSPQKVFRSFNYRKHTKSQFARDDPAFLVLLCVWLFLSSVCFALAIGLNWGQLVLFVLFVVFVDFIGADYSVRLGDVDLGRDDEPSRPVTLRVTAVRAHEQFSRVGFYNDIAILVLSENVQKSKYVIPICLPRGEVARQQFDGAMATVVGWGTTRYGGAESSRQLEARMPVWRNEDCDRAYFQPITDTFLCAGYTRGGVDACQGDSGGPLMLQANGRWTQIGVVSFGNKCGEPGYPGVYTRVTHLLQGHGFVPCLVANTFWLASVIYYLYITFLGYSNLPMLQNARVFLLPLPILFVLYLCTLIAKWNLSQMLMDFYHYRLF